MLGARLAAGRRAAVAAKQVGRRRMSSAAPENKELIYEGPFGGVLRRLKRVSVFSCASTMVSVPLLSVYGNEDMEAAQRVAVGFTVCSFAVLTTAALNFVSKPYIWRMYRLSLGNNSQRLSSLAGSPAVSHASAPAAATSASSTGEKMASSAPLVVESLNLFGRVKTTEIPNGLDDIYGCKERVFVNLGIRGKNPMYVHEDGDCYASEELYREIMNRIKVEG